MSPPLYVTTNKPSQAPLESSTKLKLGLILIQVIMSQLHDAFTSALLYVTCIKNGLYQLDVFSLTVHDDRILSSSQEAV